jgi:hypothetical protein
MSQMKKLRLISQGWVSLLFLSVLLSAAASGQSATITSTDFGMQCGPGNTSNCPPDVNTGKITLPTGPGVLRLWDSKVAWSWIDTSTGYSWTYLDKYLDAIALDPSISQVIYTFGWVPCWRATLSPCTAPGTAPAGTSYPPDDLGSGGSLSFDNFVSALTTHCSLAGNCVGKCTLSSCSKTNLIKYYELWDEANATFFWGNPTWSQAISVQELYNLVKPVISTIKANVTGAVITTPSISTATGYQTWMQNWVNQEVSSGIISNLYNIHNYLANQTPETRWTATAATVQNELYPNFHTTGWAALPWVVTETNFNGSTFTCSFSANDCTGQIVRWQALINAGGSFGPSDNFSGALNLSWYYWKATIGNTPQYLAAYNAMMAYLTNGSFTSPCSFTTDGGGNQTWSCSFTESNSTADLWVWTPDTSGLSFPVTAGKYKHYRDLSGNRFAISNTATSVSITVEPILLEVY